MQVQGCLKNKNEYIVRAEREKEKWTYEFKFLMISI